MAVKYSNETDEQFRNRMFSGSGGMSGSFNATPQLPQGWGPATAYNDSFANRLTQGHMGIPGFDPLKPKNKDPDSGFGWNMDTMNMIG